MSDNEAETSVASSSANDSADESKDSSKPSKGGKKEKQPVIFHDSKPVNWLMEKFVEKDPFKADGKDPIPHEEKKGMAWRHLFWSAVLVILCVCWVAYTIPDLIANPAVTEVDSTKQDQADWFTGNAVDIMLLNVNEFIGNYEQGTLYNATDLYTITLDGGYTNVINGTVVTKRVVNSVGYDATVVNGVLTTQGVTLTNTSCMDVIQPYLDVARANRDTLLEVIDFLSDYGVENIAFPDEVAGMLSDNMWTYENIQLMPGTLYVVPICKGLLSGLQVTMIPLDNNAFTTMNSLIDEPLVSVFSLSDSSVLKQADADPSDAVTLNFEWNYQPQTEVDVLFSTTVTRTEQVMLLGPATDYDASIGNLPVHDVEVVSLYPHTQASSAPAGSSTLGISLSQQYDLHQMTRANWATAAISGAGGTWTALLSVIAVCVAVNEFVYLQLKKRRAKVTPILPS